MTSLCLSWVNCFKAPRIEDAQIYLLKVAIVCLD